MYRELAFTITSFLDLSFRLCCCVAVNLSTRDIAARTKSRLAVTNCRKTGMSSRTLQNRGVYERCCSRSFWTLWKFIVCSVGPKAAYQTVFPTVDWFLFCRQHKLDESLAYQQFSANVGEEESWINEKNTLVGSDDYGDTLAAVQVRQLTHTCLTTSSCFLFYRVQWIEPLVSFKTKVACSLSQSFYFIRVFWRSMKRLKQIWRFIGRECRTLKMLETNWLKRWISMHCMNETVVELLLVISFFWEEKPWLSNAVYFSS